MTTRTVSFGLLFLLSLIGHAARGQEKVPITVSAPFEAGFELPAGAVVGNPFDYTQNDVQAIFLGPDRRESRIPAFFDGGRTWRVRFAPPPRSGRFTLAKVLRNGVVVMPQRLSTHALSIGTAKSSPGFVRRDPRDPSRFRFDNGRAYYPVGNNAAWKNGNGADIPDLFAHMGAAGENWSRVWMNHWDNKNLDWPQNGTLSLGTYSLDVARRWDGIVAAAERSGIYFQMVLQHHGQYSSRVNSNWNENPWNRKNGGFLDTPEAFFTDARARALTRAKYRYIIARWGYSPHVLAWELFNEVQFTDAIANKQNPSVVAWHREMAAFLRAQDPYHHLITTSSDTGIAGLFDAVDYVQPHVYPPDAVTAIPVLDPADWHKPIFFGECGPENGGDPATFLHAALWTSLTGLSSGAAQFWDWDVVDKQNLYGQYRAATGFARAFPSRSSRGMKAVHPAVETTSSGRVSFGPGGGWGAGKGNTFTVMPSGDVEGVGTMPSFLQGRAHPDLFTFAVFPVDYPRPGTFAMTLRQAAKSGAHVLVSVDGATAAEHDFPAAAADTRVNTVLEAPVPAGRHTVRIENSGADWAVIGNITLAPYGSALRAVGKADAHTAALWVYHVSGTTADNAAAPSGILLVPGLAPGPYRAVWWDTHAGKPLRAEQRVRVTGSAPLRLETPPVATDAAVVIQALDR